MVLMRQRYRSTGTYCRSWRKSGVSASSFYYYMVWPVHQVQCIVFCVFPFLLLWQEDKFSNCIRIHFFKVSPIRTVYHDLHSFSLEYSNSLQFPSYTGAPYFSAMASARLGADMVLFPSSADLPDPPRLAHN